MDRKILEELKKWKSESNGRTAILIDGARRVGKSYIAEKFARENYKSYILIDFYEAEETIKELFTSDSMIPHIEKKVNTIFANN